MLQVSFWNLMAVTYLVIGSVHAQTCNSSIISEIENCYQVYNFTSTLDKQTLEDQCQQAECFLQCLSDAVGNCYTEDEFIMYNTPIEISNTRASCSNIDLFVDGFYNCSPFDSTCLVENNITRLASELFATNATENSTAYKEVFCQYVINIIQLYNHI
ncbi:hypothetical protein ACF0H5_001552 [Mactra antiquata]